MFEGGASQFWTCLEQSNRVRSAEKKTFFNEKNMMRKDGGALLDAAEESLEDTDGAVAESQLHAAHGLEGDAVVREGGAVVAHRDHHVTLHAWSFQPHPFVRLFVPWLKNLYQGETVHAWCVHTQSDSGGSREEA